MAESGNKNKIYIVTAGPAYSVIGGELSNNITINNEVIDITDKDSNWAAKMAGENSWEASGSFNIDKASANHANLVAGASVTVFIGELSGSTPVYGVSGAAIISSETISGERNAAVTKEISFMGNGAVTRYTQAATTTVAPTTTT